MASRGVSPGTRSVFREACRLGGGEKYPAGQNKQAAGRKKNKEGSLANGAGRHGKTYRNCCGTKRLAEILPPWPAGEFLRELARFAEKNSTWGEAKSTMEAKIAERLAAKRTKKYKWLISRDIVEKHEVQKKRIRGKKTNDNRESPAGQEVIAEAETAGLSAVEASTSLPSFQPINSNLAGDSNNSEAG